MTTRSGSSSCEGASDVPSNRVRYVPQRHKLLLYLVDALAVDPSGKHARPEDLAVGNAHVVAVEDDKIGVLPRRERPEHRFLEAGIRRPDRNGLKSFFPSHLLLRIPPANWPIGWILSSDSRVKGEKWVHFLDGKISSVRYDDASVQQ